MQNIEIKARYANFGDARNIAREINADLEGTYEQVDTYFFVKRCSLKVVVGISDSAQTWFQRHFFRRPAEKTTVLRADFVFEMIPDDLGEIDIRYLSQGGQKVQDQVTIRTPTRIRIFRIYHDESRLEDARYIKAALQAIIDSRRLRATVFVQAVTDSAGLVDGADWTFWLSESNLPENLFNNQSGKVILRDAASPEYRLVERGIIAERQLVNRTPRLFRRVAALNTGVALWKDTSGEPLLEIQRKGRGLLMHFDSRFHPSWSDLVWSPAFPKWLGALLGYAEIGRSAEHSRGMFFDERAIAASQIEPEKISPDDLEKPIERKMDLHLLFWGAAVLLFALERFVSENQV